MVFIISEDVEKFPHTSKILMQKVIETAGETDILVAFLRAACPNYTLAEVNEMMSKILFPFLIGSPPRITYTLNNSDDEFHEYDHLTQTIHFGMIRASQINEKPDDEGYQKYAKAAILHELVHHVDYILDGKFEDYVIDGGKKTLPAGVVERGHYFEKLAFGGTMSMKGRPIPE